MPTTVAKLRPISTAPGVQPSRDQTRWSTPHYIESLGIRFRNGTPEKEGGYQTRGFDMDNTVSGVPRSIYSQNINGRSYTLIGTHTRLYAVIGSQLTNITPVDLDNDVTVGDTLVSQYDTLANNPIATVNGSKVLTITDSGASRLRAGDPVTFSGAATTNGVPNTDINAIQIVRTIVDATHYTIQVGTSATSSGSGGGAAMVRKSGLVRVPSAAHGLLDGDRVKIHDATTFAGLTIGQLNLEFIIRYVDANNFDVFTTGVATSSATGGGAAAAYYAPIASGAVNVSAGFGYGAGKYGVGLYGISKTSSSGFIYPRIWCFDRYSDLILCSPGNGSFLYEWDGDTAEAPVQVSGSPDGINWFFVSNNIIITMGVDTGSGLIENRIKTSDQNDRTNWTGAATNQVYDDNIEGAGRFISQMNVNDTNLLFTQNSVYTFEYIGFNTAGTTTVWKIRLLAPNCGISGPLARVAVNGVGYWQGQNNYYMYRGGNAEIMPANTQKRATNQRYAFGLLSTTQRYKSFAWHNEPYEEIDFHYPSQASGEVDTVNRYSITDQTCTNDAIDRTAAEVPFAIAFYPILAAYDGTVYRHEFGSDADGSGLPFSFITNMKSLGKNEAMLSAFIPDFTGPGSLTVTITGYQWPQSATPISTQIFTVTAESLRIPVTLNCRYWTYTIAGNEVGQEFSMGNWQEEIQLSGDGA